MSHTYGSCLFQSRCIKPLLLAALLLLNASFDLVSVPLAEPFRAVIGVGNRPPGAPVCHFLDQLPHPVKLPLPPAA